MGWSGYLMAGTRSGPGFHGQNPDRTGPITTLAKPFFPYADAAKMPPQLPPPTTEKFVPSRLLKEVIVKMISNAALQQPPARIVKAINKARAGKRGTVIAARRLESEDVLVTADSRPTKALLE
jgi:hypothetical protein